MPPSHRRKHSSSTESLTGNAPPSTGKEQLQKVRKAARLIGMVNGLQKSMEAMIENRKYYAQRSLDLEQALTESAPEALTKSISMRTIHVADIMMEVEDLSEKNATFEERIRILQHAHERGTQSMQAQLDVLQSDYNLLEAQALATQNYLEKKLREATGEAEELQKKYSNMRQSFHSCTQNIAIMASKIVSVQRENASLRVEVDEGNQALIDMMKKVKLLRESEKAMLEGVHFGGMQEPDTITTLQSQLEAANFENEKLVAERTAHRSVIEELQNPVNEPTPSLKAQSQLQNISSSSIADTRIIHCVTPSSTAEIKSISVYTASNSPKKSEQLKKWNQVDGLLSIARSMSSHSFCESTDFSTTTSDGAKLQIFEDGSVETSAHTEKETLVQTKEEIPTRARRMKVSMNGLDGAYTGPLSSSGLPNGTGTIRFKNGDTYLGDLRDGKLHGKGAMYFGAKDKTTIRGKFENNVLVE
jgi:hypothetical protein